MNNKITFIIPSIDRPTIDRTINSLYQQTDDRWEAIIIYDGIEPQENYASDKITTITSKKLGSFGERHGHAGLVRNLGLDIVETDWIGFVDDDDSIHPNYVETLFSNYSAHDLVVWRMHLAELGCVVPRGNSIKYCDVGISISFKKKIVDAGIRFKENGETEDFYFIQDILNVTDNFVITEEVYYNAGF